MSTLELVEAPEETAVPAGPTRAAIREHVLRTIREMHTVHGGLARVHHERPALYAQARRAFGSWRAAVAAAGLDYGAERSASLRKGLALRDQRRALWNALSRFLIDQPHADDAALARERPELARRVEHCWGSIATALAWADRNRQQSKFVTD